jgi:glycosyltransferase involved in cell wall biosynthesis
MPDTPPTVSVCMPVFNGEPYVREAAESILSQTFGDFEFIIIDDGSSDGSRAVLEELARRDARIRLISRPNTGYTRALNEALGLARGTYIARMDADDVSLPQRFHRQVDYLRDHPDCVLVGTRVMTVDPYGIPLYEPDQRPGHEEIEQELLNGVGWAVVHPTAMMVREQVTALGGYRPEAEPSESLDLFLRLAERGHLANLPVVLLHYRQHVRSVNQTRGDQQDAVARAVLADAHRRRGTTWTAGWPTPEREVRPIRKEIDMWTSVAIRTGHLAVARRHALSLLRIAPFSLNSWRLMYCAIRGR